MLLIVYSVEGYSASYNTNTAALGDFDDRLTAVKHLHTSSNNHSQPR